MATKHVNQLIDENREFLELYRDRYKPFNFDITTKFSLPPDSNTSLKPEELREKGTFRFKWESLDFKKNPITVKVELTYSEL